MMEIIKKIFLIKVLLLCFLMVVPLELVANNITEESTEVIRNPDIGFYKLVQIELQRDNENFDDFEDEIKDIMKNDSDVSLISFQLNLKNYTSKVSLSNNKIEEINRYFSIMRSYGYQVIFRVVYDSKGDENPEPEFDDILGHIEQLKPIYTKNEDIIFVIEAGYLGAYGEWHDGKYDRSKEKRNQIIDKLLNVVPKSIQINLRKPSFITDYIGSNNTVTKTNAYSSESIARLGLHNDGYLASETDLGTFNKEDRDKSIEWQQKQTRYTLFGGESQKASSIYTNLDNAISDMKIRHCTYLNKTYDREVKKKWKNTLYSGTDSLYKGKTGYDYIQNHLGYRLILRKCNISPHYAYGTIDIDLQIENVGFGNIVRKKQIEIIYENENNIYCIESGLDIRKQERESFYEFTITEQLPSNMEKGEYNVYLNIKEPYESLKDNDYYKIKLANEGIWNSDVGGNYIGKVVIEDKSNNNILLKIAICIFIIVITYKIMRKIK